MGITIAAVLLAMGAYAGGVEKPPATQEGLVAWHSRMTQVPRPLAPGCLAAAHPDVVWRETGCVAPPSVPMAPKLVPAARRDVGGGIGVVAERPEGAGFISRAYGGFENVNAPQSLRVNSVAPGGAVMPDSYTLQLNTNHLRVEECGGSPTPGLCWGWKQFVFANDGTQSGNPNVKLSRLYIEYWLLHYNPDTLQGQTCPPGWAEFPDQGEVHCSRKVSASAIPHVSIQKMVNPTFRLEGRTTRTDEGADVDSALFNDGAGNFYWTPETQVFKVLEPAPDEPEPGWTQVEFNVLGYGRGSTAVFNNQASFNVRTTIEDGSPARPKCHDFGFSSEKNNLRFGPPGRVPLTPAPAIVINESINGLAAAGCRIAAILGDTHQYTFAGLFYDFQATGDFVEAQAGSTFEVQTRKVSGAPNWPNTSVNRSVGMRMGSSRLALCDGTRLVVNGTNTSLPSGESLLLPTGVAIDRVNNVYTFKDPSGDSVRVTANSGYVDLGIGLGSETATVRGLLGNPNGDPNYLEARDGSVLPVPLSFSDLYGRFGNSWRVSPSATLLQPCSTVGVGNPTAPFYAGDLNPNLRTAAQATCSARSVVPQWLDSCALDVAVLGANAANVYIGLQRPAVDANPPQLPCVPNPTRPGCLGAGG
ncbi:VWD domain-containing protein [Phytohabitans suffuscus]|uniref:VWFD domain-containing protein n=1 Tax=Phytohabitans suffuscus TaxID=624315 RepID=A0A6F8YFB8_9ACTN|nr:VWD domain-containing protein [Phytohabitans suffuscus]BCB84760.1 hypothetical protein Psuf_020730 [Phytohabitans suffuscus]